jgi:hypothetical protein
MEHDPMPSIVVPNGAFQAGPGYLYRAILGSAAPTNTVAGSVFTDAWPVAWVPIGITVDGSQFTFQTNTDTIQAAEYLDPLAYKSTGRQIGVEFNMMQMTLKSYALAFNGGTTTTVSGTGATTLSSYSPANVGSEVRTMLGWESEDSTERCIFFQCFQGGQVSVANRKAPTARSIPVTFSVEQPASGGPFQVFKAGTVGVGV